MDVADRTTYITQINRDANVVWGNVTSPKAILKKYLEVHQHNCTNKELEDIFDALTPSKYDASTVDFDNKITAQLNKIAYNRNKDRINILWAEQSGFETVSEWCNNWAVPIQWVVSDEEQVYITALKTIQAGNRVDNVTLHNATQYFETHIVSALKDNAQIMNGFFSQVGESYRSAFDTSAAILVGRLKTNTKLSSDVYSWANKIGDIRKILDSFLRSKYCEDAKKYQINAGRKTSK